MAGTGRPGCGWSPWFPPQRYNLLPSSAIKAQHPTYSLKETPQGTHQRLSGVSEVNYSVISQTQRLERTSFLQHGGIVGSKTLAEADITFSNSDQCSKHLKNYGYNSANTCELPPSYIRWVQPAEDELERGCEYDMDEQGSNPTKWLQALNMERKRLSQEPVTCELFEIIMDRLEKEWFQLNQRVQKPDANMITVEDSRCAICEDGDTENSNAIVFCDGCNLAVHQDCYGVPYIPEGQWLCRKCTVSPDRPVTCELCPNSFGAFKQTSENKWAHLVCAIHIPETGVGNAMYMEPVDGVRCIPKQRWKLKCYICKKTVGACIQCANRSCCVAYHATCAQEVGLYVKMKPAGSLYPTTGARGTDEGPDSCAADHVGADGIRLSQSFCDKHTPKGHIEALQAAAVARLSNNPATTTDSSDAKKTFDPQGSDSHLAISSKKINSLDDLRALKLLATGSQTSKSARAYHKSYSSGPPLVPEVIFQRVMQYSSKLRCAHRKTILNMICKYWSLKREVRRGAPLLKRLHLEPWTAAGGISSKNEEDRRRKYGLLVAVRHDLQQVKNLAAMICKREKIKLRKAEIQKEVIEKTLFPVYQRISLALTALIEADKQKYFLHPVSATEVPDYYDIIKHPMNWSTIQRKIDRFEYFRLSEFISDVHLTLTNARIYNHASSIYHKTAIRIGKAIEPLLQELLASEPFSPIAGLASESFPTCRQKEHFAEIPLVLLPDQISDLLDVHDLPGSTTRPYDEVLRDRRAKRSTQNQTNSLLNLLPAAMHSQNQRSSSTEPPSARLVPPSQSLSEGLNSNPDVPSITNNPCDIPTSNNLQNRRVEERLRKIAGSSVGNVRQPSSSIIASLPKASSVGISNPATPSADKELKIESSETRNTQKKKRRRTATDSSDPTTNRPLKRAAPRIKPQSQLDEEALIEKQNPNATRGQLISLKLRALHAKRIEDRERNMSDDEKARRRRLREYIREKRQQHRLSSRSQTTPANQSSSDPSHASTTPNETETSLSRDVSYTASNESQSNTNNLNEQAPPAPPELWKVTEDEKASSQAELPKESTNRASSNLDFEGTASASSPTGSGTAIADSNSRTSMQKHEDMSAGIDEKSEDIHSLVTPIDPIKLALCHQVDGVPQISHASEEATTLPTSETRTTPAILRTDAEEASVVSSAHPKITQQATTVPVSLPQSYQSVNVSQGAAYLESSVMANDVSERPYTPEDCEMICDGIVPTIASEHFAPSESQAPTSDSANQPGGHSNHSQGSPAQNSDTDVQQAEVRSGTSLPHLPEHEIAIEEQMIQAGAMVPDEDMSLVISLPNGQAELVSLPSLNSHEDINDETTEGDRPLALDTTLSPNVAPVEDTHSTTVPVGTPTTLNVPEVAVPSASIQVRFDGPPIQIAPDVSTDVSLQPDFSLVNHMSSPRRPSTRSSKKLSLAQNEPTVGPVRQQPDLDPPIAQQTLVNSDLTANNAPVQSRQKLKIRIKKMDSSTSTRKGQSGETLLTEPIPISGSPKLRLILDRPPYNWKAGSSSTQDTTVGQEDVARNGKEATKAKTPKSAGSAGPPEFLTSLPGEKDSFRLFNTGFILPDRTRRHTPGPLANDSHPQSPERRESGSPEMTLRTTRVSARLKPVRLTLHHHPPIDQDTSAEASTSNCNPTGFSTNNQDRTFRAPASSAGDESGSSELSKSPSPSLDHTNSPEGNLNNSVEAQISLEAAQEECQVEMDDKDALEAPCNGQKASKTSKAAKKVKPTRAQQEKELEMDSRGFLIYPKAPQNGAKRIHPLARDAFTRMSQATRLPEEGSIEDGTLVWAKVPGHPWFPAEVGLPEDPAVPQSMLDKKPPSEKMDHHVLVMFFDRQRSWQWVQRRNTRLLGESDELDALLSSEAFVSNKTILEEIQNGCAFARSNIEQTDDAKVQEAEVPDTNQQHHSTSSKDHDFRASRKEDKANDANYQDVTFDKALNRIEDMPVGLKRTRSCRFRPLNPPLS
ncbi:uncharacterized protein PGTG_20786 [Puccinia graminis f. sp. tritici CRL 75-36-700-3]|uniref:NuA3 HAT complex component nto1 n=1 Tax=Puccinia graminis f. sp. tritici (strain CRL 75-36-700-3 / race SCCL) TaxID=418459 RepID=H6QPQ7_PUCGT|nr:uncharacterized protein PGTG_20786 [Puccinia graminis f. sp. tritici CRL 75-36-700-3]EHS64083.1 hypothetical protein PGTG_20786 [Puccinia graminis f. sp. tritici CRL 75-36-700-3]